GTPGLQEIRPEGDDVARLGEIVERKVVDAEHALVCGPLRGAIERLIVDQPASERAGPFGEQIVESAGAPSGDHRDLAACSTELLGDARDHFIPEHRLESAVPAELWPPNPTGVVEALQSGLTALTERPGVYRMGGIALELDRTGFAGFDVQPAAGGTFRTGAGI